MGSRADALRAAGRICAWCAAGAWCIGAAALPASAQGIAEALEKEAVKKTAAPAESAASPEYKAEGLKDPFKTPFRAAEKPATEEKKEEKVEAAPPAMTVQGIIWEGRVPMAIIDGNVIKVGDDIVEGVRLKAVSRDGVTIVFNNRSYELPSPAKISQESSEQKSKGGVHEK